MQCILIAYLIKLFWKIKSTILWLLHAFTYQMPLHRFNYNNGNNILINNNEANAILCC
jgi:hypothetical protein